MALFKVVSLDRCKKVAVKASTILEITQKAVVKLNLGEGVYQVVLEEDGTEVDEDDILLDIAKMSNTPVTLMLIPEGGSWRNESSLPINDIPKPLQSDITTDNQPSISASPIAETQPIYIGSNLWQKFPTRLLESCEAGEPVKHEDRRSMVAAIADYLVQDLKDSSRSTAGRIARMIFEKYPASFTDMINGQILGSGIESLRAQIYNAVHYRKDVRVNRKRAVESASDESDSESSSVSTVSRKQDEYGCVEYQPLFAAAETRVTQQEKQSRLIQYYDLKIEATDDRVIELMDETYVSQRMAINKQRRLIENVIKEWPYLTDAETVIRHATRLIGKPVRDVWTTSLTAKTEPITKYFKSSEIAKEYKMRKLMRKKNSVSEGENTPSNYVLKLLREAKDQARLVTRSEVPRFGVVFPLIVHYMKEDLNVLFMVVDEELTTEAILAKVPGMTPILIIKGKSYCDATAKYEVLIEQKMWVTTSDLLEGLLITFLMYYVFGYAYPANLASTLEFIQRVFLLINPSKGDKRDSKKRRSMSYDPKVLKLTKELNDYTNEF